MEKQELINKYQAKEASSLPEDNPIIGAMIETMDNSVGQVIRKLEELIRLIP